MDAETGDASRGDAGKLGTSCFCAAPSLEAPDHAFHTSARGMRVPAGLRRRRKNKKYQGSPRPGWPCAGKVDPATSSVAEATGGKVLLFHPAELEGVAFDK